MPQRLRVAIVFEYPTLSGGERSMLAVLDRASAEIDAVALAPAAGPLAAALGDRGIQHRPLKLHDAAGRRLPLDAACSGLRETMAECDCDLVHANSLAMGRLVGRIADALDVPTVAHLRDIIGLSRAATRDLNANSRLIAVSRATREFHLAQGLAADRVTVLYNGVDCELFHPGPVCGRLRAELGLPDEPLLVLTVGQIGLRKGQDVLAEAAVLIRERLPQAHYVLVGERLSRKPESVAFERSVQQRFEAAGMADRLHRLGSRDDVAVLMNEADLLVHAAHQEPLGRVLLEAAAAGLPIVATDVGGTREILSNGVSARLVPPARPDLLAAAIVELAHSDELRRSFADAARERVERDFSIDGAAHRLVELWRVVAEVK
ncbi:MAG: glycosyltransferase [Planctomycetes bacterium]|nr:glycosyltransferase [Planctomycetota bacterium]